MQTAASNSLVLTDFSSFRQLADLQREISYGGFYQQLASDLVKGLHTRQILSHLAKRLVDLAEHAHAFRDMDALDQVSQILISLPIDSHYKVIAQYYQALCIHRFGCGDIERAARLLETVSDHAPLRYRARVMISLGAKPRRQGDYQTALSLYREAGHFVSRNALYDPYTTLQTQRMVGVIKGLDGNHRDAITLLENLLPLARSVRLSQPHVYHDYMNSLAVELCEVGRLEEAKKVSEIVLASPFAPAYPEWRETADEIALRGRRPSRSVVAVTHGVSEPDTSGKQAEVAAKPCAPAARGTPEGRNVVTLPTARLDFRTAPPVAETQPPARVIEFPSRMTMTEQNNKDELGLSEKRRIVADELYEMFMAALEDAPVDSELVEELYGVFLKKRKKG